MIMDSLGNGDNNGASNCCGHHDKESKSERHQEMIHAREAAEVRDEKNIGERHSEDKDQDAPSPQRGNDTGDQNRDRNGEEGGYLVDQDALT